MATRAHPLILEGLKGPGAEWRRGRSEPQVRESARLPAAGSGSRAAAKQKPSWGVTVLRGPELTRSSPIRPRPACSPRATARRLYALPGVKFQKSGWNVSGFYSHGYCRRRAGDRTKETRACGEGVLWFNAGLTCGLQVLLAPRLPSSRQGSAFSSRVPSFSPPRPAPILCEKNAV